MYIWTINLKYGGPVKTSQIVSCLSYLVSKLSTNTHDGPQECIYWCSKNLFIDYPRVCLLIIQKSTTQVFFFTLDLLNSQCDFSSLEVCFLVRLLLCIVRGMGSPLLSQIRGFRFLQERSICIVDSEVGLKKAFDSAEFCQFWLSLKIHGRWWPSNGEKLP